MRLALALATLLVFARTAVAQSEIGFAPGQLWLLPRPVEVAIGPLDPVVIDELVVAGVSESEDCGRAVLVQVEVEDFALETWLSDDSLKEATPDFDRWVPIPPPSTIIPGAIEPGCPTPEFAKALRDLVVLFFQLKASHAWDCCAL